MNKKEKLEMESKIKSIQETVKILKLQESNLLEVIRLHEEDHKSMQQWVHEVFIGADYIVRLEHSIKLMKEILSHGGSNSGRKKKD